jgi:hypothetical protein
MSPEVALVGSANETLIQSQFGETLRSLILPEPLSKLCQYPISRLPPPLELEVLLLEELELLEELLEDELELDELPQLRIKVQALDQAEPVPGAYAQAALDEHQPAISQRYSLPPFCTNWPAV